MLKVIIVVPCCNEARRLKLNTFSKALHECPWLGFLFVNDGSEDQTYSLLKEFCESHRQQAYVIDLPANQGKAEAVRQGMSAATSCRPRYVGFWDADLATPLDEIATFCDVLDRRQEVALVVGSRLPLLGHRIERKATRRLLGRLFAVVASRMLSLGMHDTQCGAKLFRVDEHLNSIFQDPFHTRWILDVEILARMIALSKARGGQLVSEVIYEKPLELWCDVAGSKLKPRDFVTAIYELAIIYWRFLGPFRKPITENEFEPSLKLADMFPSAVPVLRAYDPDRRYAA